MAAVLLCMTGRLVGLMRSIKVLLNVTNRPKSPVQIHQDLDVLASCQLKAAVYSSPVCHFVLTSKVTADWDDLQA